MNESTNRLGPSLGVMLAILSIGSVLVCVAPVAPAQSTPSQPAAALVLVAQVDSALTVPAPPDSAEDREPLVSPADSLAAAALVISAREHAAADRHGAAGRDYLDALALDIRLVETIAEGIAYQDLWQEDADRAIFYFRRYLIRNPEGEHREVRKGLALALSWSGRQKQSIALYRQLVSEDPGDGAARIGLGRSMIWDNKLRSGFDVVHEVESTFEPETAPGRESSRFLLRVLDDYTAPWEARLDWSHDTDTLEIWRFTASGAFELNPSLLLLALPSFARYTQDTYPGINGYRLGAGLLTPLAHNWALHAYGWIDLFRCTEPLFQTGSSKSWNQLGTDFWFTWLPVPRLRTDFGGSVLPVETVPSLAREITTSTASASADWRFQRQWTLGLSGLASAYSDDNERLFGSVRLEWRQEGTVEFALAPIFTYLDFAIPYPGNGYWSPNWMRNGSLEALLRTRWNRWTLHVDGRIGREKETGEDTHTVGAISLRLGRRISDRSLLALAGGYSASRLASPTGFGRTHLSLIWRAFF